MTEKLSKQQAAILTAYTGVLCGSFSDFAEYSSKLLGRPIFTHQFPSLADEIKAAARQDFLAIAGGDLK